jgi:hypothetical protein
MFPLTGEGGKRQVVADFFVDRLSHYGSLNHDFASNHGLGQLIHKDSLFIIPGIKKKQIFHVENLQTMKKRFFLVTDPFQDPNGLKTVHGYSTDTM